MFIRRVLSGCAAHSPSPHRSKRAYARRLRSTKKWRRRRITIEGLEDRHLLAADLALLDSFDTWAGGLILSSDPSGVAWDATTGNLVIADSEINDTPFDAGVNLFETNTAGDVLVREIDSDNSEPTGIAYSQADGFFYITNDDEHTVSRYDDDLDNPFAVIDTTDAVSSATDPEGITADPTTGFLYVADGSDGGLQVLVYNADLVYQYNFSVAGELQDAEGIAFNPATERLFVISASDLLIAEYTLTGTLVDVYDLDNLTPAPIAPQGLTFAPTSNPLDPPGDLALYIADGGLDNVADGTIYETLVIGDQPPLGGNTIPVVDAGADQQIALPNSAQLAGVVSDDGLPAVPGTVTTVWTQLSGPGTVTFDDATDPNTIAHFPTGGVFQLQLTGSDGELTGADVVTIFVNVVEDRVSDRFDDAEERETGSVARSSPDLEMVFDQGGNQTVGLRFDDLAIPTGAVITRAYVQFTPRQSDSEPTSLTIHGEASDNATAFTSTAFGISARPNTTASTAWNPPAWNRGDTPGTAHRTPDLAAVVQEIVDRPGWSAGNALVLKITGTGERSAFSFDGSHLDAPQLRVEYSTGVGVPYTAGIDDVTANQGAPNGVVDLFAAFGDLEDADPQLTFTVVSNTDPSLFDATPIDPVAGTLTLDYAGIALGAADLTIRATDTQGLFVETTFEVGILPPAGQAILVDSFLTWDGGIIQSTDVSGLTYHGPSDHLFLVDSEINGLPDYFVGNNIFETSLAGDVIHREIESDNNEPTGITYNAFDDYFYVTNDSGGGRIYRYDINLDDPLFIHSVSADVPSATDPEGITSDPATGRLYAVSGDTGGEIQTVVYQPTATGLQFLYAFSLEPHLQDAEGIAFDPISRHLFVVDGTQNKIYEFTTVGTLLREYDLSGFSPVPVAAQGLTFGPTSDPNDDPSERSLYIADAMIDGVADGRVFEANLDIMPVAPNTPPVVDAGPDQFAAFPDIITLDGTVADDGNPVGGTLEIAWEQVSGPGTATFADASNPGTTVQLSEAGAYVLRLTATDGETYSFDEITINAGAVEVRVSSSSDDAEERANLVPNTSSSDLELVFDQNGNQTVGLRFAEVNLPANAIITNAYVQFQADETNSEPTTLTIEGEAADDALTFTTAVGNVSSRPRTSASVAWNPAAWDTVGQAGLAERTSDITTIVQEIIARPGWTSGNAIALIISGAGERVAESYDGVSSAAPLLHIEYVLPSTPPTTAGIANVNNLEDGPNEVIDLFAAFDDVEDADDQLTYTILTNTNPGLFDSTIVDGVLGTLTLDYAADAVGTADLTIRATDSSLQSVDTTFTVTLAEVNDQPVRTAGTVDQLTVAEDSGLTSLGLGGLIYSPGGGSDEAGQTLTFDVTAIPSATVGEVVLADGLTTVTVGTYSLADLQGLQFRPAIQASGGPETFSFSVTDNGTTAGASDPLTLAESLAITVTEVNDAPARTAGDVAPLTVEENSGVTSLGLAGLAYTPGGGDDELSQTLTFTVTTVPAASLGNIVLADGVTVVTPGVYSLAQIAGLQFSAALDASGGPETFALTVTDDGTTGGISDPQMIFESLTITVNAAPEIITLEARIDSSTDDAEERASGSVRLTSSDLELTTDRDDVQTIGLRFHDLAIPAGATITSAYVQFQADEASSNPTSLAIRAQATDNATTFSSTRRNVSSRPVTGTSVPWVPGAWVRVGDAGLEQRTPDLASVVQEVIDRPGWTPGNALALLITGTGERVAESYDGNAPAAPLLHVEYSTTPIPNTPPTTVGIGNVNGSEDGPAGVVDLFAAFDDAETPDEVLTYTIEQNTNPGLFSSTPIDLGTGTLTFNYTANAVGSADLTVRATDRGNPALWVETSFTVTVSEVNDAPVRTAGNVASLLVDENSGVTSLGLAGLAYTPGGGDDELGQTLTFEVTAVPAASLGNLVLADGVTVVTPGVYSLAQIAGMQFSPALNASGGPEVFVFSVTDNGTTDGTNDPQTTVETLDITVVPSGGAITLEARIDSSTDDAEERSGGGVRISSSDLELTTDRGDVQTIGLRFHDLAIPAGATITTAYVQFQADETSSNPTSLAIRAEATDDATTFISTRHNISSRSVTGASTPWEVAPWTGVGDAGLEQRTPELAAVIQEVIDRPGWTTGNALALIITGTGERVAESYNGNGPAAPLLHIEYTTGSPLLAATVGSSEASSEPLTAQQLETIATAAADRLVEQFGDAAHDAADTPVRLADLDGRLLGLTQDQMVLIDRDAAGWGWFVDQTPYDDHEFDAGIGVDALAAQRVDLLSVVMHELGHRIGLEHGEQLDAILEPGQRQLPDGEIAEDAQDHHAADAFYRELGF